MNPKISFYRNINGGVTKRLESPDYNYIMSLATGVFARWGKTREDDPEYSPFGPEILDIEVSTVCHGSKSGPCKFCYKSNGPIGKNMSFETFKTIFDKMPKTLTQIAFGIGDIDANYDLWKMMRYCRDHTIVPNLTINGSRMTPHFYDLIASNCGACAVSLYDYDTCYNAVKELTDRGMKQVNIHCLLSEETFEKCKKVLKDRLIDPRLQNMKSIVFMWLKPKGNRNDLHQLSSISKLKELVDFAFENEISIGFDSCSSPNFLKTIKDNQNFKQIEQSVEPCESTLFSSYINVDGDFFPCSFAEKTKGWEDGISVVNSFDFNQDVWFNPRVVEFRNKLIANKDENKCRTCQLYDLCVKN